MRHEVHHYLSMLVCRGRHRPASGAESIKKEEAPSFVEMGDQVGAEFMNSLPAQLVSSYQAAWYPILRLEAN
jgi:hypothetical protein